MLGGGNNMILYKIRNIKTDETIAYFKSGAMAREYLEFYPNMECEKIQIMYDAIDVFKGDDIVG